MKTIATILAAAVILGGCATAADKARSRAFDQIVLADPTICEGRDLVNMPSPRAPGYYAGEDWARVHTTEKYKEDVSLYFSCKRNTNYQAAERKRAANAAVAGFVLAIAGAALDAHHHRPPKHGPRPPKPPRRARPPRRPPPRR